MDIDPSRLTDLDPSDHDALLEAIRELAVAVAELQGRVAALETATSSSGDAD